MNQIKKIIDFLGSSYPRRTDEERHSFQNSNYEIPRGITQWWEMGLADFIKYIHKASNGEGIFAYIKSCQYTEHLVQELNTENKELKSLIYGMLDEINELKNINQRLNKFELENKKLSSRLDLLINLESENNKNIEKESENTKKLSSRLDLLINLESENNKNIEKVSSQFELEKKKISSRLDLLINLESENNKNIEKVISRVDNLGDLIDMMMTESEKNKKRIDELTEHNKQLSSRLFDIENKQTPPPLILI
jgi:DNA repair exonuclease SbcCD ATPase subunit